MKSLPAIATLLLASCASISSDAQLAGAPDARLGALAAQVSAVRLRAVIESMVGFGTRHTLSDARSDTRGVGAARRWVAAEFGRIGMECGGCLEVATPSAVITAPPRVPQPVEIVNVVAIQRGTTDPTRVIIIQGHLDSRVSDPMDAVSDAPGANDDASGVAAVIEAARILSKQTYSATLVYAALTGEEQGLHGGKILADYAKAQGWRVEAVLNNDIIGNSHGSGGQTVTDRVRVFSEGVRSVEPQAIAAARTSTGGEVDSASRNLARFIDKLADRQMDGFGVSMVYRRDRFGRGGDQIPMLEAGFPAVRLSEAAENYDRQHQDLRTENGRVYGDTIDGVDFEYLSRVTQLNVMAMGALALAPPPPEQVDIRGAVSADTTVTWSATPGAAGYRVWWRETTSAQWTDFQDAGAGATSLTLPGRIVDDWFFGVSTLSADGYESPVRFAGPVGAFFPAN